MTRIYKYPISITQNQEILAPQGAQVIHAGLDPQGNPCVWAIVDPRNEDQPITILLYGTGWQMSEAPGRHIGTINHGPMMWHVFLTPPSC